MRALLLALLCCCVNPVFGKDTVLGQPAPALEAKRLDGADFSLAAAKGKVVIVNFWATWCSPCREEMPALDAFYKQHQAEGLEVIAISLDAPEDLALVKQVMAAFSFSAALSQDTKAKGYGRLWRVPLTFVIDRHGILRRDGWTATAKIDAAALDATVLPLLGEP